jgi:DNA polymerase-3 subunit gamma/tau
MRDALSLLDQAIAYSAGNVSEAAARAMLGTVDDSFLFAILDAIGAGDVAAALAAADDMEVRNISFDSALQDLATLLHRVALAQSAPEALAEGTARRERVLALARQFDPEEVQLHYQIVLHGRHDLPLAPDDYAGFTMTLLRMIAFRPQGPGIATKEAAPEPLIARAENAPRSAPKIEPKSAPKIELKNEAAVFDGDWPKLARQLGVSGLAKQLAQQSVLKSFDGDAMVLGIAPSARQLAEKPYQDKLQAALAEHLRRPLRLSIQIGSTGGETAHDRAESAINQDTFVRELLDHFDGTIVKSSIKPAT